MYNVGERVRVTIGPGKTCRGLVLCVWSSHEGHPSYDVLLQPPGPTSTAAAAATTSITAAIAKSCHRGHDAAATAAAADDNGRELTGLPGTDLSPLQPFEIGDKAGGDESESARGEEEVSRAAEKLKDSGNVLFKLGDTDAAAEMFARALKALERTPVVGATVLVRLEPAAGAASSFRFRSGMISDANGDVDGGGSPSYDVIFDKADSGSTRQRRQAAAEEEVERERQDDEEDGVAAGRVLSVPSSPCVWCAARLNLARCSFRRGRHDEVVQACTLVLAVAKLAIAEKERPRDERAKLRTHCLTALRIRGGSHLAQNHVGLARKDARSMVRSSGDSEQGLTQAARFEAEVERKANALLKANRRLAKDVTRWVDASMAQHEEAAAALRGDDGGGDALPGPPLQQEGWGSNGGVEQSKGGGRNHGDSGEAGVMSWLGGWIR